MCCSNLPGVAISTFVYGMEACSRSNVVPPMIRPADISCLFANLAKQSKVCIASSRVGLMTTAPGPSILDHRNRHNLSTIGIKNASVLPDPVVAAPSTSLPRSATGIALRWISVGTAKPADASPVFVRVDSGKSANLFAVAGSYSCSQGSHEVGVEGRGSDRGYVSSNAGRNTRRRSVLFFDEPRGSKTPRQLLARTVAKSRTTTRDQHTIARKLPAKEIAGHTERRVRLKGVN